MATASLAPVLHYLRKVTTPAAAADVSDAELLSRFSRHRDEAAFTALVRRHGPMVLAVCRQIVRDGHTAEDAFQATFLVLARKAGSLARPELLGHFLHGVAYRTAAKAKTEAAKRRAREQQAVRTQEINADDELSRQDLRAVLDEEVNRLPERYRVPVVLCYLQGHTNAEAARRLGCSRGTIATLLARARAKLRRRLTQRGVGLSAGIALTMLTQAVRGSAVSFPLEHVTVKAATLLAAGQTQAAGALVAQAVALAKGVSKGMLIEKLKIPVAILMMTALVGTGAGVTAYRVRAQEAEIAAPAETESKPRPSAKTERPRKHVTMPVEPPKDEKANKEGRQRKDQPLTRPREAVPVKFKWRLPAGPAPVQVLVVLGEKDRLFVCRKITQALPVSEEVTLKDGQRQLVTSYFEGQYDLAESYDTAVIRVYDTKGQAVDVKELRKRLKGETLALLSANGRPVDPLHLRLYKEDTLIFVLPPRDDPYRPVSPAPLAPAPPVDDPEESVPPSGS